MSCYLTSLRKMVGTRLLLCPSVAAVIHDNAGRLLLQEKASGEGWSLPAGAIEPGETPQEAIIRETREETGLLVSTVELIEVFGGAAFRYTYPNGDKVEYVVNLFKCRVIGWTDEGHGGETRSIGYFTPQTMPALALPYPKSLLFA